MGKTRLLLLPQLRHRPPPQRKARSTGCSMSRPLHRLPTRSVAGILWEMRLRCPGRRAAPAHFPRTQAVHRLRSRRQRDRQRAACSTNQPLQSLNSELLVGTRRRHVHTQRRSAMQTPLWKLRKQLHLRPLPLPLRLPQSRGRKCQFLMAMRMVECLPTPPPPSCQQLEAAGPGR